MSADEPTPPGPQMPCPDCGATMHLPKEALFAGQAAACPSCGLQLRLEVKSERGALRQLEQAAARLASLKASLAAPSSGGSGES